MPKLTEDLARKITEVAKLQWQQSSKFKQPRMEAIKENEDYALGIVKPDLEIPYNDCYPVMSGYVNDMMSKIDEAPSLTFTPQSKADYLIAEKISAAFQREVASKKPTAKWRLKDRWCKKNALFSGRGIFKYHSSSPGGKYTSNLKVVSHYDFHCEPDGGGDLENHLFMGEESIFKTKEDLLIGAKQGVYDAVQVGKLINNYNDDEYKNNRDEFDNRANRSRALNLDVTGNNYTGQPLFKFVEWYLTYMGIRWYCLFEESTYEWIRVKPLIEIIQSNAFPYCSWSTDEDPNVFWNLAPCDPVKVLAKATNRFINQEVYNREKQNKGQKAYDAEMFLDIEALDDPSVDTLIPVKVPKGKSIASGIHEFVVPGLGGTINLVEFLNQFVGSKTGQAPGSQGVSDKNKKVGIFFGELEQANEFIGTKNKSYTECHEELGLKFAEGLIQNLDNRGIEIQLMGASGIEWQRLTGYELRQRGSIDFDINISGGAEQDELNEVERRKKMEGLASLVTVNPQWKDREIMRNSGYTDEEINEAFSTDTSNSKKLVAQAYEAIENIEQGRPARINRDANARFLQTIIDYSKSVDISDELFDKLFEYAMQHIEIAARNTGREAREAINAMNTQKIQVQANALTPNGPAPARSGVSPEGISTSIGNSISNEMRQ